MVGRTISVIIEIQPVKVAESNNLTMIFLLMGACYMLGQKFRKLRQCKNISLDKACEDITSKSSLQRWESGIAEMSYNKVLKLLNRIHIQPKEFIDLIQSSELNAYVEPLEEPVKNNDIEKIKDLALLFLKLHYQSNDS